MSDKLCVCGLSNATIGSVVLHADHLAAMAAASDYDEAAENARFEAEYPHLNHRECAEAPGTYWAAKTQDTWEVWKDCAKARAKAARSL